jgi:hypothetical protein
VALRTVPSAIGALQRGRSYAHRDIVWKLTQVSTTWILSCRSDWPARAVFRCPTVRIAKESRRVERSNDLVGVMKETIRKLWDVWGKKIERVGLGRGCRRQRPGNCHSVQAHTTFLITEKRKRLDKLKYHRTEYQSKGRTNRPASTAWH